MEAKRLPKYRTKNDEEYVVGDDSFTKISGGIQRYKALIHGNYESKHNGMIAYVENESIDVWLSIVNEKLLKKYPNDTRLIANNFKDEFTSTHRFDNSEKEFIMHHFWVNLI